MKLSGLDEMLKEMRRDQVEFVYAGYSAAGCVLAPCLKPYELVDLAIVAYHELKEVIWEGLGIVPWAFMPHWRSDHPESDAIERAIQFCKEAGMPYLAVRDGDVVIVESD